MLVPVFLAPSTLLRLELLVNSSIRHRLVELVAWGLGGPTAYRLGRALYLRARSEDENDPFENGEVQLARHLASLPTEHGFGSTMLDIGANMGDWTRGALDRASETAHIYCFEPIAGTRAMLEQNLAKHGSQVTVVPRGMSSEPGQASMHLVGSGAGRNSLYRCEGAEQLETVRLTSIDAFLSEEAIDRCLMVKIDVEGHDLGVLRGAEQSLAKGILGCVQFEYGPMWVESRSFLKDVFELVEPTDYLIARLTPSRLEILEEWHPELDRFFLTNFVLLHHSLKPHIPHVVGSFGVANAYQPDNESEGNATWTWQAG